MPDTRFDPAHAVTFDFGSGHVHQGDTAKHVLVPASALAELCALGGPEAARALGAALGGSIGGRVIGALNGAEGVRRASLDAVVDHVGGEMAARGLGSLSMERWGRALVAVVDQPELPSKALEALLEHALGDASGRKLRALAVSEEGGRTRLLVTSEDGAKKVRGWIDDGTSWGEALVRLHGADGGAS